MVRECVKYCKGSQVRNKGFLIHVRFVILFTVKGCIKMSRLDGIQLI